METTQLELAAIEAAATKETEAHVQQLSDLQLLFIGGGTGDISFG